MWSLTSVAAVSPPWKDLWPGLFGTQRPGALTGRSPASPGCAGPGTRTCGCPGPVVTELQASPGGCPTGGDAALFRCHWLRTPHRAGKGLGEGGHCQIPLKKRAGHALRELWACSVFSSISEMGLALRRPNAKAAPAPSC